MNGLDTNVLVRFITQDDDAQARRVDELLAQSKDAGDKLRLDSVVLCELVWVLRGVYERSQTEIVRVLEALLDTPEFVIDESDLVRSATADFAAGKADFADYLLGRRNGRCGCTTTFTFDRGLRQEARFTLL